MTTASPSAAATPTPPLPRLTPESDFFWTSGADAVLRIQQCPETHTWIHPPRPDCGPAGEYVPVPMAVSGRGTVFSFTINRQPFLPSLPPPYVVAIVELDEQEGLQLTTRVVNCEPEEVHIGQRVTVVFEQHGDIYLPFFEPLKGGENR